MKALRDYDYRGWRIPREGTRSRHLYHLLDLGYSAAEICRLYQLDYTKSTIKVLCHNIQNPIKHNARGNKWYKANPNKTKRMAKATKKLYSSYVIKLTKALGISYTEAVALERKELEKLNAKASV